MCWYLEGRYICAWRSSAPAGVVNIQDQDVGSTDFDEIVHNRRDLLLLDHGADSNPAFLFKEVMVGARLPGVTLVASARDALRDVILA